MRITICASCGDVVDRSEYGVLNGIVYCGICAPIHGASMVSNKRCEWCDQHIGEGEVPARVHTRKGVVFYHPECWEVDFGQ